MSRASIAAGERRGLERPGAAAARLAPRLAEAAHVDARPAAPAAPARAGRAASGLGVRWRQGVCRDRHLHARDFRSAAPTRRARRAGVPCPPRLSPPARRPPFCWELRLARRARRAALPRLPPRPPLARARPVASWRSSCGRRWPTRVRPGALVRGAQVPRRGGPGWPDGGADRGAARRRAARRTRRLVPGPAPPGPAAPARLQPGGAAGAARSRRAPACRCATVSSARPAPRQVGRGRARAPGGGARWSAGARGARASPCWWTTWSPRARRSRPARRRFERPGRPGCGGRLRAHAGALSGATGNAVWRPVPPVYHQRGHRNSDTRRAACASRSRGAT